MKIRTVVIRPPSDDDPIRDLIDFGRSLDLSKSVAVETLALSFSLPEYGWILLVISAGGSTADWDLCDAPDPFASERYRYGGYCLTWLAWLEDVISGQPAALGIDMEGPVGVLLIIGPPASSIVTFIALSDPMKVEFAVRIERRALVRDIYTALIAFWEGDALKPVWSHWSSKPQWSLRSAVVEDYLAAPV